MEQQAHRMHSYRPSSLARSSLLCRNSLPSLRKQGPAGALISRQPKREGSKPAATRAAPRPLPCAHGLGLVVCRYGWMCLYCA